MICETQEDSFYEVLSGALLEPEIADLKQLDPERKRAVARLNGLVTEIAVWTDLSDEDVKSEIGCTQSNRDLLFKSDLDVLRCCATYLEYVRDVSKAAPEPAAGHMGLTSAVEVFRRAQRDPVLAQVAMNEVVPVIGASAMDLICRGEVARALLSALASDALRNHLDIEQFDPEVEDRVLQAVRTAAA